MQNILVYGTILFDHMREGYFIGGCHTNVAVHCAKLGLDTTMISCVGQDQLGEKAVRWMSSLGIHTEYVRVDASHPTGTVEVDLSDPLDPKYLLLDDVAYDYLQLDPSQLESLGKQEFDFLYFSTSEQRHRRNTDTLCRLLDTVKVRNVFLDVNIRKDCYTIPMVLASLEKADIVKANEEELDFLVMHALGKKPERADEETNVRAVMQRYSIRMVIITRGSRGASVYEKDRRIDRDAIPVSVVDAVGAGDGFSAAFLQKYGQTGDTQEALQAGIRMGSFVSGCRSATPDYTEELMQQMRQ